MSRISGLPKLPSPGKQWAYAYVSPMAIDDDDPKCFAELINAATKKASANKYDYIVLGLAAAHPLLDIARKICRYREYISHLYLVAWDKSPANINRIKAAIPHPEVALL